MGALKLSFVTRFGMNNHNNSYDYYEATGYTDVNVTGVTLIDYPCNLDRQVNIG